MGISSSKKCSVLLVHSFSEKLLTLRGNLSDFVRIYAVKSGKAAMRSLRMVKSMSLIVLDLELIGMSGYEFLDFLKNSDEYDKIPVLVLTDNPQKEISKKLKSYSSVAAVFNKTYDVTEFRESVAELLGVQASSLERGSE
jgi:response regulator RpfG family c-di-GMP phosphodiesterase